MVNFWQMNMHKGVTPLSHEIYNLHMISIWVCAAIGILVFGVMIYALIYHRKSRGHKAHAFHENLTVEIIWTTIPFLILVALAIPATTTLIRLEDSKDSDVTVKIVGYQWRWEYQYLDEGIKFFSNLATPYAQIENKEPKSPNYLLEVDKPLVLPIHKKIRFLVTANDVVHSWWVPELGVKRDAIPGFMHEAWAWIEKPGIYRGQCTELCGINHGFMPIVVKAVSQQDFDAWVQKQEKVPDPNSNIGANKVLTRDELMQNGEKQYLKLCAACHKADGKGMPPLYPGLKNSSVAVGKPIARHIALILYGIPGSAMQPYKEQLTDEEIAALVTYERNAWGNNTGDLVQPLDVAKTRSSYAVKPVIVNHKFRSGRIGGKE